MIHEDALIFLGLHTLSLSSLHISTACIYPWICNYIESLTRITTGYWTLLPQHVDLDSPGGVVLCHRVILLERQMGEHFPARITVGSSVETRE